MTREPIPEDIQRFILMTVTSVPYLEAMLLMHNEPMRKWTRGEVAARLYVNEAKSSLLLTELCEAGVATHVSNDDSYSYQPSSEEYHRMIGRLAKVYAENLVEVAQLIHSATGKKARQFADAFKWRKD